MTDSESKKFFSDRRMVIWITVISSFVATFTGSAVNLLIPSISHEFASSAKLTGWIVSGLMLSNTAFSLPFGRIADLIGRGKILKMGILLFSIFSLGCVFSTSMIFFIIMRVFQGIGGAMLFSTNMALLAASCSPEERGRVLGYGVSAVYVGLSAGPVLGGVLNHYFQWRSVFIFTVLIGIIVFFLALKFLPKDKLDDREGSGGIDRFDIFGSITCILSICLILYGFTSFADSLISKLMIPAGLAVALLFVRNELRVKSPIIQVRLFAENHNYTFSSIAALLNYGATFAISYLMSIYLQLSMGFDSQLAGLILIVQPVTMAILAPQAGKLSDRVSPFKLASIGMAVCSVGLCSFAFLPVTNSLIHVMINLLVMGVGIGIFSTPNTNAVMSCVHPRDFGVTTSLLATVRTLGQTSGMAVITLIVSAHLGQASFAQASQAELGNIVQTGFITFTILCLAGVFFSMQRKK